MLSVNGRSCHVTRRICVRLRRWKGVQSIELRRLNSGEGSHVWLLGERSAATSWQAISTCVGL